MPALMRIDGDDGRQRRRTGITQANGHQFGGTIPDTGITVLLGGVLVCSVLFYFVLF